MTGFSNKLYPATGKLPSPELTLHPSPPNSPDGWEYPPDLHLPRSGSKSIAHVNTWDLRGPIRIEPSKVHEELLKKESIRPPVFGGRSKNQQLGSVAESWGVDPSIELPKGMFELDDDPPSPVLDRQLTPAELREERTRRALLGIPAEKSGRPSIKDMEKEKINKMKQQELRAERKKNDINMSQVSFPIPDRCKLLSVAAGGSTGIHGTSIDQVQRHRVRLPIYRRCFRPWSVSAFSTYESLGPAQREASMERLRRQGDRRR